MECVKTVREGGTSGVCGSPVVRDGLDSLPHTACVVVVGSFWE